MFVELTVFPKPVPTSLWPILRVAFFYSWCNRPLLDVLQSVLHKENQKREPLPSVARFLAINVAKGKPKKGAAPIRRLNFRNRCCKRKTKKGSRSHPSLDVSQSMLQKENQKREPLPSVA
jgi:hypothetical protein